MLPKKKSSFLQESGKETVSVEYGITYQNAKGSYIKIRAERSTVIRQDESSDDAYERVWAEVINQVEAVAE